MQSLRSSADGPLKVQSRAMRCSLRVSLFLVVLLAACGGRPAPPPGFINHTQHSDANLWGLWRQAQQNLSQRIDLNPLQQEMNNAAPDIHPGDPRALNVIPKQVVVAAQRDVSASVLFAATETTLSDPTGLIQCPQPCNVTYAPAYSLYTRQSTNYAASWEFNGNNFDVLVEYEFENQILNSLGYDMKWR